MMARSGNPDQASPSNRRLLEAFNSKVPAWLRYTESASGWLRTALVSRNLMSYLSSSSGPQRIMDAGCGTGELASMLSSEGHSLLLLDYSSAMLAEARRRCEGLDVDYVCADVMQVAELFTHAAFNVVLCHSVLEFVDDVKETTLRLTRILREGGLLSVLVGNRYHAPLRKAVVQQDFDGARLALTDGEQDIDLFGLPRRTLYPEDIRAAMESCGLRVLGEFGVRVFADLLPAPPGNLDSLLALELAAGTLMPYRHIARFVQFIAAK